MDPKADLLAPGRESAPTSWVEPITMLVMPTSPVMTGFPRVIAQLARYSRRPRLDDRDRGRTGLQAFSSALGAAPCRLARSARRRHRPAAPTPDRTPSTEV